MWNIFPVEQPNKLRLQNSPCIGSGRDGRDGRDRDEPGAVWDVDIRRDFWNYSTRSPSEGPESGKSVVNQFHASCTFSSKLAVCKSSEVEKLAYQPWWTHIQLSTSKQVELMEVVLSRPISWCRWGVPWKALAHHGQATVVLQKHFKVFLVDLHIREWVGGVSAAKDIFQIAFDSASKTSLWAYVLLIECYWFLIEFIMAKKRVAYFRSSHLDLGSDHLRKTDAQDTADADKVFR